MHIATCGHEVDEGICCTVDNGDFSFDGRKLVTYGTYCWECIKSRNPDEILNSEIKKAVIEANSIK